MLARSMVETSQDGFAMIVYFFDEIVFVLLLLVGELALAFIEDIPVDLREVLGDAETPLCVVVHLGFARAHHISELVFLKAMVETAYRVVGHIPALLLQAIFLAELLGPWLELAQPLTQHSLEHGLVLEMPVILAKRGFALRQVVGHRGWRELGR